MRKPFKKQLEKVAVLTGAGVSAESGIPTFRSGGKSMAWKGMPFEVISSAAMARENLEEVWEWFDYRRGEYAHCSPNPAHHALAAIERVCESFTLATQNVDGLHRQAGSRNVVELHGSVQRARCVACGKEYELESGRIPHHPSECSVCGARLRPDVVLFGEMLPEGAYETALEAASQCGVFLIVGTSALVYPAAMLPQAAIENGAYVIEVNPEETPLSAMCDASYRGPAGELLPRLASDLWNV